MKIDRNAKAAVPRQHSLGAKLQEREPDSYLASVLSKIKATEEIDSIERGQYSEQHALTKTQVFAEIHEHPDPGELSESQTNRHNSRANYKDLNETRSARTVSIEQKSRNESTKTKRPYIRSQTLDYDNRYASRGLNGRSKTVDNHDIRGETDDNFVSAHSESYRQSFSMDLNSPVDNWCHKELLRIRSNDDSIDHDALNITEFIKGPFYNIDYEVFEMGLPCVSKVRYNDTGSLEQVNEEELDILEQFNFDEITSEKSESTNTLRDIWDLRATLEYEDNCSHSFSLEALPSSPEQSPEPEPPTSCTTSFESNTEAIPYMDDQFSIIVSAHNGDSVPLTQLCTRRASAHLLHPNYERKRESYRNILTRRLQSNQHPVTSADNSFDSIETVDTDGDVSDTSRYEMTTTSFESTTDNTDSTNESQTNKLRQMKADSGYKSLEIQQSTHTTDRPSTSGKKQIQFALDQDDSIEENPNAESGSGVRRMSDLQMKRYKHFDRRNGKTASKKRREYKKEKQIVHVYDSLQEPEPEHHRPEMPLGGSLDKQLERPNKLLAFTRFFKSYKEPPSRSLSRDYSVDKKTSSIFNDFLRSDLILDTTSLQLRRSPRSHSRYKIMRKNTEPGEDEYRPKMSTPGMRSSSIGGEIGGNASFLLSTHESIDEEYTEKLGQLTTQMEPEDTIQRAPKHDIPIIKLPEEESIAS